VRRWLATFFNVSDVRDKHRAGGASSGETQQPGARQLDSLQNEEYDDSPYDPVVTLHHTDRENQAMASVFSYYYAFFPSSSDPHGQLTQSTRVGHDLHCPDYIIPNSSLIVELIRLFTDTIIQCHIQSILSLHGTAANDADMSTRKLRRFL
jgi:hypothetical protein